MDTHEDFPVTPGPTTEIDLTLSSLKQFRDPLSKALSSALGQAQRNAIDDDSGFHEIVLYYLKTLIETNAKTIELISNQHMNIEACFEELRADFNALKKQGATNADTSL